MLSLFFFPLFFFPFFWFDLVDLFRFVLFVGVLVLLCLFVEFLFLFCFLIVNYLGMEIVREEKISQKSTLKFCGWHKRWEKISMGGK